MIAFALPGISMLCVTDVVAKVTLVFLLCSRSVTIGERSTFASFVSGCQPWCWSMWITWHYCS